MSISRLDQIVKGAPSPGTSLPIVVSRSSSPAPPSGDTGICNPRSGTPLPPVDPLATVPSSPPQIYLNLLILEASLRSQYLTLRARRRQYTFFLLVLTIWITCFFYALFLRPREDGSGVGGSVYWVVEMAEKVALMGGVVTGILMWGTGQWDRGVRWPRRWVGVANRGLRNINAKIVIVKGSWWSEVLSFMYSLFHFISFLPCRGIAPLYPCPSFAKLRWLISHSRLEHEDLQLSVGEDVLPGGDYIKLLLLPKPFSADFRENWEMYRLEYWERENERRALLRQQLKKGKRDIVKQHKGWFWWADWRARYMYKDTDPRSEDTGKGHNKSVSDKDSKRHSFTRSGSQSQNTSRSSTPANVETDERPSSARIRRRSSNASGSEKRRRIKTSTSSENSRVPRLILEKPASNVVKNVENSNFNEFLS